MDSMNAGLGATMAVGGGVGLYGLGRVTHALVKAPIQSTAPVLRDMARSWSDAAVGLTEDAGKAVAQLGVDREFRALTIEPEATRQAVKTLNAGGKWGVAGLVGGVAALGAGIVLATRLGPDH